MELVKELQQTAGGSIGIGLGPGRATLDFSRAFSSRLREDPTVPKVNLVAITAGRPGPLPRVLPPSASSTFLRPPTLTKGLAFLPKPLFVAAPSKRSGPALGAGRPSRRPKTFTW